MTVPDIALTSDDNGDYVDLSDRPMALIVTPGEGTLIFNGVCGRLTGYLKKENVRGFEVKEAGEDVLLQLTCNNWKTLHVSTLTLGKSKDKAAMQAWVEKVNVHYKRL